MEYYYLSIRVAKIKKTQRLTMPHIGKDVNNPKLSYTDGGNV